MAYNDNKSKRADNEAVVQQISDAKDPYKPGQEIAQCDKSAKFHLTAMNQTVAQNAANKEQNPNRNEKPQYTTTKDLHYPVGSFQNAKIREQKDVPDFINVHNLMKT